MGPWRHLPARDSVRPVQRTALLVLALALAALSCRPGRQASGPERPAEPVAYRISGTVLKADSKDHSGILVFCAGTSYLAYSDSRGSYTLTGVPPGSYRVQAQHSDYQPAFIGDAALTEGVADPAVPALLPDKTLQPKFSPAQQAERILCSIMGVARLKDQPSAEGIVVRAVGTDFRTVTDVSGSYQLLRLDPEQYTIVFEKAGYREQRMPARLISGDLVFPDPIVLEPLVERPGGRVLAGSVALLDPKGQRINDYSNVLVYLEGSTQMTPPGPGGLFRFEGLAPARYGVAALGVAFVGRDREDVDLTAGDVTTVALTLRSGEAATSAPGALAGRILKDDPRDSLVGTMVGLTEIGITLMTDARGGYSFPGVPPGTYTLVAQTEGYFPGLLEQVNISEGQTAQAADLTLEKRRDYPRVLFTAPANGDRNLVIRDIVPVTIRFSKKMRAESLRAALSIEPRVGFRLFTGRDHPQSDYDRLYIELLGFGTEAPLHFDAEYAVTVSTAASDDEDLHLQQPYRFSFRTGRASIVATRPDDGATRVFLDSALFRVGISCNARLDPKTVTADKIRIRPSLGNAPQVNLVNSPASGWSEITIAATWERGVRYTVSVSSGIRTFDGSPISNLPYTFSFTTDAGRPIDFAPGARVPARR